MMFIEYDSDNHPYFCNECELADRRIVIQWPTRVSALSPFMWGHVGVYRTAEHAFQATRALDLDSAMLMEYDGPFSNPRVLAKWPHEGKRVDCRKEVLAKIKSKGCLLLGQIAQMAARVPEETAMETWGLRLGRAMNPDQVTSVWTFIMKQKFLLGSSQAQILLSTKDAQLVCHNPEATLLSFKTARVDPVSQTVIGLNTAGKCLMTVRADLERELLMIKLRDSPAWIASKKQKCADQEDAQALFAKLIECYE
jgi:predicted NAD-dependent protein-ADP-ribosyltransferase YbiA (DUF1768 family)